ncbi:MAG TPA: Na+/H+ antiporter NhaA [Solirubrobacteraceae bacterium]|nr:Na+/H+ antiporter NhaA [Solirubrobacteraceae bacterium]
MSTSGPADVFSGRTAWARNLAAPIRSYLSTQTGGAAVMLGAVVAALLWANIDYSSYQSVWTTKLSITLGSGHLSLDLRQWLNEGLMTFFFLVVGLEAKREMDLGELRDRTRVALPVVAAVGGVTVPIAIYLAFNAGGPGAHGWGAAMSTDTAFALGLLALLVPRTATRLRVFLLTLAVVDDLIALIVIATVYTSQVSVVPLVIAIAVFAVIFAVRLAPARVRRPVVISLGFVLWGALFKSGIDPLVSGLAVGLVISAFPPERSDLERVTELARSFREQPTPELARSTQQSLVSAISGNERLQYTLHPWTSYVIVPLFALANAGIQINGHVLSTAVHSPITQGIFFGYVVGKPVGITLASWLATRPWLGRIHPVISPPVTLAGGAVAGVGFTVSILIATLAFHGQRLADAKLGTLAAAIGAGCTGWLVTRLIRRIPDALRARQIAATAEDLLDLAEDVDPERDHIRGGGDATVTLVEYGDYECSYCGQAERVIRELLVSFGHDVEYVWRHLPLNDVHTYAQTAAEAAEAAHAQGKFWEMHDRLLEHQDELGFPDLVRHAEAIGLDVERFRDELRRRVYAPRIAEDVASADASGVAGTPTFFINGRRHYGAYDLETLTETVKAASTRAAQLARASVPA